MFVEGDVLLVDAEGPYGPVAGVAQRPLRLQLTTPKGHQVVRVVVELQLNIVVVFVSAVVLQFLYEVVRRGRDGGGVGQELRKETTDLRESIELY